MWRHLAANALTFFIVALFLVAGLVTWGTQEYSDEGPLAEPICLRVAGGSTMRQVSQQLAEQGAISSPAIFRMGADYTNRTENLKQGSFLIPARASMDEITTLVTRNGASSCGTEVVFRVGVNRTLAEVRELDPATDAFVERAEFEPLADEPAPADYEAVRAEADTTYRIVIAEGVTSWQVVQALNGIDVLEGEVAEVPPEGTLATQDYPVTPGTTVTDLLAQMTANQSAHPRRGLGGARARPPLRHARGGPDPRLHRREGDGRRRGARGRRLRPREPPERRHGAPVRPDDHLRHHAGRGARSTARSASPTSRAGRRASCTARCSTTPMS